MTGTEYYKQGWALLRANDYEGAVDLCTRALEEMPEQDSMLNIRASAYQHLKDYEKALADYTRIITLWPQYIDGWNSRGHLYHSLGEYDKAIDDFTRCIPLLSPGSAYAWSNRGISYYEKGDLDAALADFNTCIERWGIPEAAAWALLHRGRVWEKKGDLEKALADFTLSAEYEPTLAESFYRAGYIWFMRGKQEKAIECFTKAIEADDDYAPYYLARGVCYWNICAGEKLPYWDKKGGGIIDQAEEDFTKAIEYDDRMADAYLKRGTVRCYKARDGKSILKSMVGKKAADDAQRLLILAGFGKAGAQELIPKADAVMRMSRAGRDEINASLAQAFGSLAESDAEDAIEDLERCIALAPDTAEAFYQRGLCYAVLGEKDKALADYEQTCALDPLHANAAQKRDEIKASGAPGGPSLTTR